jgi:hypothetical protein
VLSEIAVLGGASVQLLRFLKSVNVPFYPTILPFAVRNKADVLAFEVRLFSNHFFCFIFVLI